MKRHSSDPMADKAVSTNFSNAISKQQDAGGSFAEGSTALKPKSRRSMKEAKSVKSTKSRKGDRSGMHHSPKSQRRPPPMLKLIGNEIGKIGPSKEDSSLHCVLHPISRDNFSGQDLEKFPIFSPDAMNTPTQLKPKSKASVYAGKSKVVPEQSRSIQAKVAPEQSRSVQTRVAPEQSRSIQTKMVPEHSRSMQAKVAPEQSRSVQQPRVTSAVPGDNVSKMGVGGRDSYYCVVKSRRSKSPGSTFKSPMKIPSSRKSIGRTFTASKVQKERSKSQKPFKSKMFSKSTVAAAKSYSPGKSNQSKSKTLSSDKSNTSPRG